MGQQIDQFYENLRVKLTDAKNHVDGLKVKIEAKAQNAEQDVRSHLDHVQKRIEQDRTKVSAAQAEVTNWVEAKKSAPPRRSPSGKQNTKQASCKTAPIEPSAMPQPRSKWLWQPSMMRNRQRLKPGSHGKIRILLKPNKRQSPSGSWLSKIDWIALQ